MGKAIKLQEKEQGKKIQHNAGKVWGWDTPAGILRVKRRVKEFLRRLNLGKTKEVLEIGCGTGIFTEFFLEKGMKLIAIDISLDLLKKARERKPGCVFIQADAENLPFKENIFDCVLGVSVLHHTDVNLALRAIRAVLKERGVILFSEPNMANPQIYLQKRIRFIKRLLKDTPYETAFLRWKLKKNLEYNNFSHIDIYPFEFLHPLTPGFLIPLVRKAEVYLERIPLFREIAGSLLIFAQK